MHRGRRRHDGLMSRWRHHRRRMHRLARIRWGHCRRVGGCRRRRRLRYVGASRWRAGTSRLSIVGGPSLCVRVP